MFNWYSTSDLIQLYLGAKKGKGGGLKSWFQDETYLGTLHLPRWSLKMAPLLHIWAFEAANKGSLLGHISSLLPITAGWTAVFLKVWFYRGLPRPNEIFEVGTLNTGIWTHDLLTTSTTS